MKLIGSLTSPYVRKIRVMLLEKNLPFDFIVDSPWEPGTRVTEFNPLGKVPALVTDDGETLFDSNILAEYIELVDARKTPPGKTPRFLPEDRAAALRVRQLVVLADGICDAGLAVMLENRRPADKQNADWISRQQGKLARGLDALESRAAAAPWLDGEDMTLADIAAACMLSWLDFRQINAGWRDGRPALAALADKLAARPSFRQTIPLM
jgi:glutathione S-transferase